MVDACTSAGILPFYGPYGDIRDVEGCETQFRAAFLLGCVGAWSLHPVQIEIAKKVFSPDPEEVLFAKKVLEAIPDGRGVHMIDGKMQDDATWKQCKVMVSLAEMLAHKDPELAEAYGFDADRGVTIQRCGSQPKSTTRCARRSSSPPPTDEKPVKAERIATAQDIPLNFLENILGELRHAGIVRSHRGAEGGFRLAKPADQITVADVIRAVEGPLASVRGGAARGGVLRGRGGGAAAGVDRGPGEPAQAWSSTSRSPTSPTGKLPQVDRPAGRGPGGLGHAVRTAASGAAAPDVDDVAARRARAPRSAPGSAAPAPARPPGSSSSIRTSKPRCTTRSTIASIESASGVSETATSCGRTSRPSSRLTGPRKPITKSFAGLVVDLARRADLLDPALVHHRDPVGDLHRLLLVVGDEHGGHALLVVEPAQPAAQLGADVRVERAERLVEQQHARLDRQRAGQRHPLALAARELVGTLLAPRRSARRAPAARRRARLISGLAVACGSAGRTRRSRARSCARTAA